MVDSWVADWTARTAVYSAGHLAAKRADQLEYQTAGKMAASRADR